MPYPRKNIRLQSGYYLGQKPHFVTICCQNRERLIRNPVRAAWLIDVLRRESATRGFEVFAYCVMPDHFHVLATGTGPDSDLLEFIEAFKRTSSYEYSTKMQGRGRTAPTEKRAHRSRATVASTQATSKSAPGVLWQKKFYDHILRERDNFAGVAEYIWMNPVRAGICTDPCEYPYSGSFVTDWKKAIAPVDTWVPDWKPSLRRSHRLA